MTKTLIVSDLHIPFHDDAALDVVYSIMRDIKFDNFVVNGDLIDGWELSRFSKDPRNKVSFGDEIEVASSILKEFSNLTNGKKYFIVGNHDWRFEKYLIDEAPGLISLPYLNLNNLLELDKYGFQEINMGKESYVDINGVLVGHFNKVSKHSAYTAKNLVEQYGKSVVQGHVHRLGVHYKTVNGKTLVGVEGGCLCRLDPLYMILPNWQQGITIMTSDGENNWIEPVHINNGVAVYGGVYYGRKNSR